MPDILTYGFMQRAFVAGIVIAITLPVLGSFLLARRYAMVADSMAHVSLAGVGAGILLGAAPTLVALPVAVLGGLTLEYLRQKQRLSGETALALIMSGGLALAVVFAGLASGSRTDFSSYLFGSIATTTVADIVILAAIALLIAVYVVTQYRSLAHIAFDEESARVAGVSVTFHAYALIALTAAMVALGLRVVGGLLISAILVVPAVTAGLLAHSFRSSLIIATLFGCIAVLGGLTLSFYIGIAAGATIVLVALILFVAALFIRS